MSYGKRIVGCLLPCLVLAGCSSTPPQHAADFTVLPDTETVAAEPVLVVPSQVAATPSSAPVTAPASTPAVLPAAPIATPVPAPTRFSETWIPLDRWCRANGYSAPQRYTTDPPPGYAIAISNASLTLRVGSRVAYWNGMEFYLGFAPEVIEGAPCIHELDVRKNLEPMIDRSAGMAKSNPVIVIDPGHGGTDTGTRSVFDGRYEKEFTLDLARRLQWLLATNGWTVVLTRTSDVYVALSNRVALAERQHADLFLSLHFNSSAPDHEQAGLETYCLTPAGMPSNLTRGYYDNPSRAFPNNNFDTQNMQYAALLHRAALQVNGRLDRGVRRARFLGVLQNQNRPAVFIEGGYLSNLREAREISDPLYRQRFAETIANALVSMNGVRSNAPGHSPTTAAAAAAATNTSAGSEGRTN